MRLSWHTWDMACKPLFGIELLHMSIEAKWHASAGDPEMAPLMCAVTRLELDNNSPHMVQQPWSSLNVSFSNKHKEIDLSKSLFKLSSQ